MMAGDVSNRVLLEPGSLADRLYNDLMRDKYGRWAEHFDDEALVGLCERAQEVAVAMPLSDESRRRLRGGQHL